ncbi:serine hydrolase [Thalassoroseus pseudoceratinae]|uniref:serine hydrolase n=1 Tax=Thalassoroseus pseudoceratinae TaxID=2713176 RepID=UPI001980EFD7|nr:serine hydrolase [Thalassoroseus pseudoceratinae]
MRSRVFLILLACGAGNALHAAEAPRIHKDLEFATVDGHHLKLDLYLPDAENPPLVVWIHGGGWRAGSKEKCYVNWLPEHGYAVASISYRLTDVATFPAQIHDCKAAVRWLRANAEKYGYRTDRVAVAGASAGGQLAALLGTTADVEELEGTVGGNRDYSSRVDAIVDFYGATDFLQRTKTQPHKTIKAGSVVNRLLGGPADEKVELARLASAAFHVTNDDPPLLIFHGRKDNTVLLGQSERIVDVYQRTKLPVTLHVLDESGHGGNEFLRGENRRRMVSFLDQHLKSQNEDHADLPRSTPESQGVSSKAIRKFVKAADETIDSMHSFMLVRHGHVIAEGWWEPESAEKPHILWSLSKSFTSTAVGLAVAEGKLDIDDQVIEFFPKDAPAEPSENLKAMRVRDLLTMSTGHNAEPWWSGDEVWTKRFLAQPVPHKPGSHFMYNTPATYMLSAIVQKVTGQTVLDYLTPRLFHPLGIEKPTWDQSPQGISIGGYGLYLRTEDIAKFGQLYLQKGQWNGKKLIPANWVTQATSKQVDNNNARHARNPDWRQGYGFQFWRCRHGAFRGDGKDGQFCIVLPKQDAVIAITAKTGNMQKQLDLVWEHLLPAFHDELPENPTEAKKLRSVLSDLNLADRFLQTPAYVGPPKQPDHATDNRAFQGIPSMAVAPNGRLWANWYAGVTPGEDQNNYVAVSTSGDDGKSWREVLVIDPDGAGPVRTFDPELWVAPTGRMFVFWAQSQGHAGSVAGVWCIHTDNPGDEKPQWSQPRRLTDGIMMCKPVVLSTGEWVLPASTWKKTDNSARMVVSTTLGRSWSLRGACNVPEKVRTFDEHIITERKDGSLWMLARTTYGIGESLSTDGGKTWPELKPSPIAHPSARFFVRRLNSGKLLLVKHGPIKERTGRSHLTAYVSDDDGRTWTGGLLLDERSGVSYPDGQQTADGRIRIIYDYSRVGSRHILMATFREADIEAGKIVSEDASLRQMVSDASGGQEKQQP